MRNILPLLLLLGAGCIIPDTGIVVYSTQECGYQFSASTNWARGSDGSGYLEYILIDGKPVTETWC